MSHLRLRGAVLAATAVVLAGAAPSSAATSTKSDLTVMTRNLYLGADIIPLATQPDLASFEKAATERLNIVLGNDFATRAKGLASEIAKNRPDLIGVQEAANWFRSPDGVKDGAATPSTQVIYNSLDLLTKAIKAKGLTYKVVVKRTWLDIEAPTSLGYDVRLQQVDAVLARAGSPVKLGKSLSGGFTKHFDVTTQAGPAKSLRGWVGVDAKVGGKAFRFVSTHLEAYSPDIAKAQMQELLAKPLASKARRSILVGDFNSDPKSVGGSDRGTERTGDAYDEAIAAGFASTVPRRLTSGFAEDLHDTSKKFDEWLDHIMARPKIKALSSRLVGDAPSDRVGGLWPSDHAGVVARLRLK